MTLRLVLVAVLLALSGCVAPKYDFAPAAHYGPSDAKIEPTDDQGEVVDNLVALLKRRGIATTVDFDPGAMLAARGLVNVLIDQPQVLPSQGRSVLRDSGLADFGIAYHATRRGMTANPPGEQELGKLLDSFGPVGANLLVGVADRKDGVQNCRHWAVVLVRRVVAFDKVFRRWEPDTRYAVGGKFLEAVDSPRLWILRPDGEVEHRDLKPGPDGTFSEELQLAGKGQGVLQVRAKWKGVNRTFAVVPFGVGEPVGAWPKKVGDVEVERASELETLLTRLASSAAGKSYGSSPELTEAAKSCLSALAEQRPCGERDWIYFATPARSIERMTSEVLGWPNVVALLKDSKLDRLAVAAAEVPGERFAVVLAFGGGEAPAAEPATKTIEAAPAP